MSGRLLDAAALAEMFDADENQVKEWHRRYRWPHVKIGREVRWTPEQADAIVRQHTVTGNAGTTPASDGRTRLSAARGRSA